VTDDDALLRTDDADVRESQFYNEKKRYKAESEKAQKFKKRVEKANDDKKMAIDENKKLKLQLDAQTIEAQQLILEVTQERNDCVKERDVVVEEARAEERTEAYREGVEDGKQIILPRLDQIKIQLAATKKRADMVTGEKLKMEHSINGLLDEARNQAQTEIDALKAQTTALEAEKFNLHSDLEKAEEALMNYATSAVALSENTLSSIMKKLLPSELVESFQKVQNLDKIGILFNDVATMGVDTRRLLAKIGLQLMNLILEPLKAGDKDFPGVFRAIMRLQGVSETPFGKGMSAIISEAAPDPIYEILFDSY
jgi:hypothetical protein